ncbi:response regulator [Streptomyces sp. NA04227]|uniref:response regulator n=1 Tax=Streptomyces sp. NA04227 TaxID=2742136 RepID=UPI001590FFFD|nr:response regulator [Streptomyces sp. NA04227]QKW05152.1 response regulator [Streptomyces sp. NA04227]
MSAERDRASILIVDDMEENLVALEAVLGPLTDVVRARSGEEALKAMLREDFAVVLVDVLMPGMNGFETVAHIKGLDQTKDVPVILLTGAEVDPDYAYRGYTVGAADFLVKPFDPWLLRTKVSVFLELHRKNRQLAAQSEQLRQLLIADGRGPAPAPEAARTTPEGTDEAAPEPENLTEVRDRLARVEELLRAKEDTAPDELADRIAQLETSITRWQPESESEPNPDAGTETGPGD